MSMDVSLRREFLCGPQRVCYGVQVDGRTETPAKGGTSRFKGVSWSSRSRKWRAQLWFSSNVRKAGPPRPHCCSNMPVARPVPATCVPLRAD